MKYIRSALFLAMALTLQFLPTQSLAAFGLTTTTDAYTVDTGSGLVFKVRRTDNGSSTQSPGDIMSLVYNGVEYQNQSRGSQINSGFDWLYSGVSAVSVSATTVGSDYIKVTVQAGNLTHYYMARRGYKDIYMGTYFTSEPNIHGHCRYILRVPSSLLPNGPTPSDIRNNTGAIESGDIFGMADGTTRSKHYSNIRQMDWNYIGATGSSVGLFIVRDNQEGSSCGPFYRSLLNQCGSDQEITYIINYGEAKTEEYRTGTLNTYTLVATSGGTPSTSIDTSWFSQMGLKGYVAPAERGRVIGVGIAGRDAAYPYTVRFSNTKAQYYAVASTSNGSFGCYNMIPGTYDMTIYKGELAVWTGSTTVTAGIATSLHTITITADPSFTSTIWRIGDWDGTPAGFLNADLVTYMHPSDKRMHTWNPGTFTVGSSPTWYMPCYQWKDINGNETVRFNLNSSQVADAVIRIGLTCSYSSARPRISVNSWTSSIPSASSQPSTRTLTVGTYRGNNVTYTFNVPASALVAGLNTLIINPVSGSGLSGFLSAGYSLDCLEMSIVGTPAKPYYRFMNRASGLYLDGMGSTANGSDCAQWSGGSSYNQQWEIITVGNYVQLKNRATGLYLDGMGRTSNGSNAGQWSGSSSYNQQWTETVSGSYYRYQNRATGLFLDGMGRTANGSIVGQWSDSSSSNQQWVRESL